MTPKEKAVELLEKFYIELKEHKGFYDIETARQCAIISVDEIIRLSERADLFLMKTKRQLLTGFKPTENYMEYWADVKKELKNLPA